MEASESVHCFIVCREAPKRSGGQERIEPPVVGAYLVIPCECLRLSWPMTCNIETCRRIDQIWICKGYTVVYFVDRYCWWLVYTTGWCCPKSPRGNNCLWKCLFQNWNCFAHLHSPKYSCHSKLTLSVAFY